MADVEIKTVTVPSLIGQAIYPRWWRHPLLWWKMRHLRADLARPVDPTVQALSADLERRTSLPEPGRYRHFKGGAYDLLSVGKHTETGEVLVVYRAADEPTTVWVRPLEMFMECVDQPGGRLPRFVSAPLPEVTATNCALPDG